MYLHHSGDMIPAHRYKHDCAQCRYLGQFENFDLYRCDGAAASGGGTYIARASSDAPDYLSMPADMVADKDKMGYSIRPALLEAHRRFKDQ